MGLDKIKNSSYTFYMNKKINIKFPIKSISKINISRVDFVGFAKGQFDRLAKKNLNVPISLFQL